MKFLCRLKKSIVYSSSPRSGMPLAPLGLNSTSAESSNATSITLEDAVVLEDVEVPAEVALTVAEVDHVSSFQIGHVVPQLKVNPTQKKRSDKFGNIATSVAVGNTGIGGDILLKTMSFVLPRTLNLHSKLIPLDTTWLESPSLTKTISIFPMAMDSLVPTSPVGFDGVG